MSMDDDMFNVPDNDDDMNEDDDDMDMNSQDMNSQDIGDGDGDGDGDEDDNDEDDEENDDDDNDDEDEDDDDEDDDEDNEDKDGEDDDKEDKFEDAQTLSSPEKREREREREREQRRSSQEPDSVGEGQEQRDQDAMDLDASSREQLIQRAKNSFDLDIVPSVALPYSTQCHAIAFTDGPKWIITGGEDGYIRKYDFISSLQGKAPLTMAQKHNLVDSVNKAGVINSYWENEQPYTRQELMKINPKVKESDFTNGTISYEPKLNPVYALEAERNGYWCLSGVLSGGISLYTMRYNEGGLHHYFNHSTKTTTPDLNSGHSSAISALKLNQSQKRFMSGSWDKTIREWDLDSGKCTSLFTGSSGQISQIQFRPDGLGDLTLDFEDEKSDMESLFGDSEEEGPEAHANKEREEKEEKVKKSNLTSASSKTLKNESVFMSSHSDGTVNIWDVRTGTTPIIKYEVPAGTPPWCMSSAWSNNGDFIYVGRRNSTVDELSLRMPHKRNNLNYVPNVSKTLRFPKISGPVTALTTMPNDNYLLCGSSDNIRLYNLGLYNAEDPSNVLKDAKKTQATPFLIVPGHHGGVLSLLHVDETGRFMVSASGNRGWGNSSYTESVLVYEIEFDSK